MTKTNENLANTSESQETFTTLGNNFALQTAVKPKTKSKRRWKHTQPDLMVNCFICAEKFSIKYILPRQQYSQKNNWGYWTGKEIFRDKYLCDNCLIKIHQGGIINWVENEEKADIFYTYLSRKTFQQKSN
ncbi:MAG: hypothetical protein MRECE_3c003 [Mycoplasmataceae bacterium CE_OT135]|nr:MAG: hypothetical protein MRECE_18c020 [Mycoplasmataceae bacterium CE_OT135]KLL04080.1 MAG: hypothetical protein MRECE_3c003 [Mycoplasmataceae bacterium CE_OT135]